MRIFAVWLVVLAMACGDDGGVGAPDGGPVVESMDGSVLDGDTPDPGMDMALDAGDQDAGPEPGADAGTGPDAGSPCEFIRCSANASCEVFSSAGSTSTRCSSCAGGGKSPQTFSSN